MRDKIRLRNNTSERTGYRTDSVVRAVAHHSDCPVALVTLS